MKKMYCSLENSRDFLSGLYYAYVRLLEIESAWLLNVKDFKFKIKLGKKLGYDKDEVLRIARRLEEMFCLKATAYEPEGFEDFFGKIITAQTLAEITNAIYTFHVLLNEYIVTQLSAVAPLADEPTYRLLHFLQKAGEAHTTYFHGIIMDIQMSDPGKITARLYGNDNNVPGWKPTPQRADSFVFSKKSYLTMKTLEDLIVKKKEMEKFVHYITIDIEICAMEVCARNIIEYREMPLEFKTDMCQQIWDEGRHAELLADYLHKMGTAIGDYPYTGSVWFKYEKGIDLAERLAIQQVLQEGDSVDNNIGLIEFFSQYKEYDELCDILKFINADETIHARIGNKWIHYLSDYSDTRYLSILESAAAKIDTTVPGSIVFRPSARYVAGFPEWFIKAHQHDHNSAKG